MDSKRKEDLYKWLESHNIQSRNLHTDFSDAVEMAKLLKKLYPTLVDIENYPRRGRIELKLQNWELLNTKVLRKLGIKRTLATLKKYATSQSGAIEKLLIDVMDLQCAEPLSQDLSLDPQIIPGERPDIMTIVTNLQFKNQIVQIPEKVILYSSFQKIVRLNEQKARQIKILEEQLAAIKRAEKACKLLRQQNSRRSMLSKKAKRVKKKHEWQN